MPAITLPDLNNAKLDIDHIAAIATSTELTATDRLGQTKRTLKGQMKAVDDELAAKLDNAQSQINVKVNEAAGHASDSAASALEAYGYLQAYRATSYGALESDPDTDPLGNPPTVGDEYFNTTANLLKRWNGTTWQASDISTANLAASSGSSLVGYDGGTVQDVLDGAVSKADYVELRAYTGRAKRIYITGLLVTAKPAGIAGVFQYDSTDTTSADNGGTIIVGADGRRWKRQYDGELHLKWFGAVGTGGVDDYEAIMRAHDALPAVGGTINIGRGSYLHNSNIVFTKKVRLVGEGVAYANGVSPSEFVKGASVNGIGVSLSYPGITVDNVAFRGLPGNTGDGVAILESRITLSDVAAFGMGRDGVRIGQDAGPSNCNLWTIRNLRAKHNGRHGLHISDKVRPELPDANGGTLYSPDLQYNGECGLYLGNNIVNTFIGVCAQQNGTYGIRSTSSSTGNFFYGGDYEVNGRAEGSSSTTYYDFLIEAGSSGNTIFGGSCYNFPQSFRCDEPENMIVGFRDGVYSGDDKYAGMQLFNVDSPVPTVFDWYQEGTFTPIITGSTSAGSGTYTVQNGRYTRIGNRVTFSATVTWSAHTGTGNMSISGLPFASSTAAGFVPVAITAFGLAKPANTVVTAMVVPNSSSVALYSYLATDLAMTNAALAIDTAATVYISGTYEVA